MATKPGKEQLIRALTGFLTEGETNERATWELVDRTQKELEQQHIDLAAFAYRLLVAGGILPGRF